MPIATTMGWVQSPPTFSAMSKTVCDLTNERFRQSPRHAPPHRLKGMAEQQDHLARQHVARARPDNDATSHMTLVAASRALGNPATTPTDWPGEERAPPLNRPLRRPVGHTDIFVDNFIQLGQGVPVRMNALRCHLLHAVYDVLATALRMSRTKMKPSP